MGPTEPRVTTTHAPYKASKQHQPPSNHTTQITNQKTQPQPYGFMGPEASNHWVVRVVCDRR